MSYGISIEINPAGSKCHVHFELRDYVTDDVVQQSMFTYRIVPVDPRVDIRDVSVILHEVSAYISRHVMSPLVDAYHESDGRFPDVADEVLRPDV